MDQQHKQIRAKLLKEQELILGQVGRASDCLLGQDIVELSIVFQMRDRLDRVELALARLENGKYGLCQSCDRPIDPARLEIKPEADLCLNCQLQVEHQRCQPHLSTLVYSSFVECDKWQR
jgi:RNA polymerase-binding transcription factor DksA